VCPLHQLTHYAVVKKKNVTSSWEAVTLYQSPPSLNMGLILINSIYIQSPEILQISCPEESISFFAPWSQ
jgi:hypothetical protein